MSCWVLSESTRLAAVAACTSTDSVGLLLAAVATGATAMSAKLPAPDAGTAAQPGPNGELTAAGAGVSALAAALSEELDDAPASEEPPELQAVSAIVNPATAAVATPRGRRVLVTVRAPSCPVRSPHSPGRRDARRGHGQFAT